MAQFGSEVTAAPEVTAYETPKQGAELRVSTLIPQQAEPTGMFEMAAGVVAGIFDAKKEAKSNQFITDFYNKQLNIADAYAQGRGNMTANQAQTLMRRNLIDAIAANPNNAAMAKELLDIQGKLTGVTGAGGIVSDMTLEERRQNALVDAAVEQGYASPYANAEETKQGISMMQQQKEAARRYKDQMDTIDMALKNNQLSKAERESLQGQREQASNEFIRSSAQPQMTAVTTEFNKILMSDLSPAEKTTQIELFFANWQAGVSGYIGEAESAKVSAFLKPFEMIKENFLKQASGELTLNELKTQNQILMEGQKAVLMADPELQTIIAASDLLDLGVFGSQVQQKAAQTFLRRFGQIHEGNLGDVNPFGEGADYKTSLNLEMKTLVNGMNNPEKRDQSVSYLNDFFKTIELSEGVIRDDPKKGYNLVEQFASPSFYNLIKQGGDELGNLEAAKNVVAEHFGDEVWDMVKREFTNAQVFVQPTGGMKDVGRGRSEAVPAPEGITARATSSGMEFVANDPDNSRMVAKAKELNKTLKPVINKTVQAMSHLDGSQDYQGYWEAISERMFGDEKISGDAGDDLLMEDFTQPDRQTQVKVPRHILENEPLQQEIDTFVTEMGGDRDELYRMFKGESGFKRTARNPSGATGLAQIMPNSARLIGYTTEQIAAMDEAGQMRVYMDYLRHWGYDGSQPLALMQAAPAYANKPDNFPVYRKGSAAWKQNPGWRPANGGDITVGSIKAYYDKG